MKQKLQIRQTGATKAIKNIRRATRKQYSAEEKIRIILDGLRRDQLTSAFQRALPETGREIALRIAFAATFGPIYAWYVLARAIMRLWPEPQEAGAAVRLLIQA